MLTNPLRFDSHVLLRLLLTITLLTLSAACAADVDSSPHGETKLAVPPMDRYYLCGASLGDQRFEALATSKHDSLELWATRGDGTWTEHSLTSVDGRRGYWAEPTWKAALRLDRDRRAHLFLYRDGSATGALPCEERRPLEVLEMGVFHGVDGSRARDARHGAWDEPGQPVQVGDVLPTAGWIHLPEGVWMRLFCPDFGARGLLYSADRRELAAGLEQVAAGCGVTL